MAANHFRFTAKDEAEAKIIFADLIAAKPEEKLEILFDLSKEEITLLSSWCAEKNFMKVYKRKIDSQRTAQMIIDDHKQLYQEIERNKELTLALTRNENAIRELTSRVVHIREKTIDL